MKILVTWWSSTGNTKKVAEAIFEALPGEKTIKPFAEVESIDSYDLVFVGFPVRQFGVHAGVRKFISTHAAGKKIALFVTHAMLSQGNDPAKQRLLEKELERCRTAFSESELVGFFHCQGELSEPVAAELMQSGIPMLQGFASMQPLTAGHPDQSELEQAKDFTSKVITGDMR